MAERVEKQSSDDSSFNILTELSSQVEEENTAENAVVTESTPLVIHVIHRSDDHERTGTVFSSIFTLVSTMIGGGILSLPFAFQQGGFILTSVILLCVLMASTHGAFLIINSKRYCQGKIKNVEDVANVAFGNKGKILTQVVFIVTLFLCSVAYWILITDQIEPIIVLLVGHHSFWSKKIVILTIPMLIIFPITLLKSLNALRFTSVLSVLCVVFLACVVIFKSIKSDIGGPVDDPKNPVQWWPTDFGGFLTAIAISGLTFSCHFNILPMHGELQYQTRANKRIVLYTAMAINYILNVLVSFFGFFQFRQFIDQDITKNYRHDDVLVNIGRVALACTLLLSFPLLIFPCRAVINRLIWRIETKTLLQSQPSTTSRSLEYLSNATGTGPSRVTWLVETGLLVFLGYILAYYIPQVAMVWGFVGAIGSTIMIYILPPAFYLRVRIHPERPDLKQVAAWGLMLTGFLVLFVGTYQSFANVINPIPKLTPQHPLTNSTS
ncbi:unnamed protein product [Porites lobata]|uniref:Putative sodium-coupled neutral amino acid transporter 11 n=1 Tax=Porites lobata TaxID=104759 RepID=A0ABN8QP41_9CNID|nr:unnamed protein product [Porites lobata]